MRHQLLTTLAAAALIAGCKAPAPAPADKAEAAAPATAAPAAATPAGWKTHADPELGVSFDYPADRQIMRCPDIEGPCAMVGGGGRSPLMVQPFDGGLEAVAREHAGFEPQGTQQGAEWKTTYGRFEPVTVQRFTGEGWTGMRATITCGISDESGFHAGAGECLWAVLSDGARSAVVTTDGLLPIDAEVERTVASVRFLQGR